MDVCMHVYSFFFLSSFNILFFSSLFDTQYKIGWLIVFYGISTLVSYVEPNSIFMYITCKQMAYW